MTSNNMRTYPVHPAPNPAPLPEPTTFGVATSTSFKGTTKLPGVSGDVLRTYADPRKLDSLLLTSRSEPGDREATHMLIPPAPPAKRVVARTASTMSAKTTKKDQRKLEIQREKEARVAELNEAQRREFERRRLDKAKRKEAAFHETMGRVVAGIEGREPAVQEAVRSIDREAAYKAKQNGIMHNAWRRGVFEPIQAQVEAAVAERDVLDIEAKSNDRNRRYLKATNTKVGVYRDIVIESDYDPFTWRSDVIRADVTGVVDPMKHDLTKARDEMRIISAGKPKNTFERLADHSALQSHLDAKDGRPTLKTTLWSMLDATPYGHYTKGEHGELETDADALEMHGRALGSQRQNSELTRTAMDQYNVATGPEVVNAEMPQGKKITDPTPFMLRRAKAAALTDVLSYRDALSTHSQLKVENKLDGDSWLAYQGKRTGLREKLPRLKTRFDKDFGMIVRHTIDAEAPGTTTGDQWLEYQGKRICEAPDAKENRNGLFPVINQEDLMVSNLAKIASKKTYGDLWLEKRGKGGMGHRIEDSVDDCFDHSHVPDKDLDVTLKPFVSIREAAPITSWESKKKAPVVVVESS